MKNTFLAALSILIFACGSAWAQGTEFTYQGSLINGGTPATGSYDFEFRLFDAVSAGSQVGSALARNSVTVANGSFSVLLDFGSAFPGAPRFLEILVRQSGVGTLTPLTPRHAISTVPYSIKSETADLAANATNSTQLGGVDASQYVLTGDSRMTDARPPTAGSGNYIQNSATLQPGSFNISGSGTVAGALSAYGAGNNITIFGINSAGTGVSGSTDTGIGVQGGAVSSGNGVSGTSSSGNGVYGQSTAFTGVTRGVYGQSNSTSGRGVYGSAAATSGSTYGVFGDSASPFGTGVYGNAYSVGGSGLGVFGESNTGTGVLGQGNGQGSIAIRAQGTSWFKGDTTPLNAANTGSGTGIVVGSSGNIGYIQAFDYSAFQTRILALNNSGGNVGINTTAPTQQLDVNGAARVRILLAAPPVANVCVDSSNNLVNCATSSLRFKTNVHKYADGLNVLQKLHPISYNWKEGGAYDIGLGAEDVARAAPFFAFRNKEGAVEGVRYERLSMVLINAVNEQQQQIDDQKETMMRQQAEIDELKALVCASQPNAKICPSK
jgi:hypothetical protein